MASAPASAAGETALRAALEEAAFELADCQEAIGQLMGSDYEAAMWRLSNARLGRLVALADAMRDATMSETGCVICQADDGEGHAGSCPVLAYDKAKSLK